MDTLMACIDCYQFIAGISAEERGEDYPQATRDALDTAGNRYVNGDDYDTFSTTSCELCGSTLAGERHAVVDMADDFRWKRLR